MKPRHAAALALVSWYLMVPPQVYTEPISLRVSIPPFGREWRVLSQTDNADDCAYLLAFGLTHEKFTMVEVREAFRYGGICVRDDDPRINPNPPTPIPERER